MYLCIINYKFMKRIHLLLLLFFLGLPPYCVFAQSVGEKIKALIPSGEKVYRHGYSELDNDGKALYNSIIESLCGFEANNASPNYYHRCDLTGVPTSRNIYTLMADIKRIEHDVPEMFILSSYIPRTDYGTGMYYARIGITNNPQKYLEELQKLKDAADEILKPTKEDMSDYEKLKIIHDGFINWGDYGDMTGADAGNIRGALINKRAVCEGFARAGLFLCQRAGLKCIYVEGQLRTSSVNDTWGNHAWNFVQVDGKWYLMDLTTDGGFAGICGYSAFLQGQDYFLENYKLTYKDGSDPNLNGMYQTLPTLEATSYSATSSINDVENYATQSIRKPRKNLGINGQVTISHAHHLYNINGIRMR